MYIIYRGVRVRQSSCCRWSWEIKIRKDLRWHGNASTRGKGSKIRGTPSKTGFSWGISAISSNFSEIPLNSNFEENCISFSPLFYSNILEGFPNIFEGIPNIFDPFPLFFDPFPLFSKTFKLMFPHIFISFLKF